MLHGLWHDLLERIYNRTIMKKLLLLFIFLPILCTSFSQDQKIEGIGLFKIGQTHVSIIDKLSEDINTKTISCNSSSDFYEIEYSKTKYIIQTFPDTVKEYNSPPGSSLCQNVKSFSVKGFYVAGIQLKDLKLQFYNDTLYYVSCDYTSDISEAMKLKYGVGKLETKKKEIECKNSYSGTKRTLTETTIYETWEHDEITAIGRILEFYNSKCERQLTSLFSVYNETKYLMVYNKEAEIKRRINDAIKDKKKKDLEGF